MLVFQMEQLFVCGTILPITGHLLFLVLLVFVTTKKYPTHFQMPLEWEKIIFC